MLKRQRILLSILNEAARPLSHVELVKAAFLLKQETRLANELSFYEFVPYRFGPFSFALYRELSALSRDGYVCENELTVQMGHRIPKEIACQLDTIPTSTRKLVKRIVVGYLKGISQEELLSDIYRRYPWFATKSELSHLVTSIPNSPNAPLAVYTIGYEGKSVDGFFNDLLLNGIQNILDVRANPISRKYGFARKSMSQIANKLGIEYQHLPELGIPSGERISLSDFESYQILLNRYENEMLPEKTKYVDAAIRAMKTKPSALLCMEKNVQCCHRGRLAKAVEARSMLKIAHL